MTSKPLVEIDFVELPDGTLLDTIEDPNDAAKTLLAIYRDKSVKYADRFECDDRIFVPLSRTTEIVKHIQLARGAKPYTSTTHLIAALDAAFSWCLDMPRLQNMLLASFVVSTWLIEKLPIAPYVSLVGLPRSGKTTTMGLLNSLCRHSLLTSDITSASFYEACTRFTLTVLIDETATAGDLRALLHLLRVGNTKGPVAIRKNKTYHAYGPKVVCWTQLPDDAAFNSRCIILPLQETERRDLLRLRDPKIQAHADEVRQMLQQYRFENFNRLSLARVPGDDCLNSRSRDLYEALALPIADENIREFLAVQFQLQQNFNRDPLSPVQVAILNVLESHIHENPSDSTCANSDLTAAVNVRLEYERELFHATPRQVGHVLTSFGLTERKRTNTGWVLVLSRDTRDRIHKLVRRYGVEMNSSVNRDACDFCISRKKPPAGGPESGPGPQKAPLSDGSEDEQSEHSELRALEKG